MKKHYPLLTLLFGLSVTTVAAPIQPQKAKQLAANFFGNSSKNNRAPLKISYQPQGDATTGNSLYYVINKGNDQGFVVISGDTRTRAVLAYSEKGHLNEEDILNHQSIQGMFIEYEEQIEWAIQNVKDVPSESYKMLAARQDFKEPRHIIEPLLEVRKSNRAQKRATPISMGQRWPFNLYSPTMINHYNDSEKTVAGCVATGISTVLRWHEWPARPKGSTEYTWRRTGKKMSINYDEQPAYDWNIMPEGIDVKGNDRVTGQRVTENQADNIGRLLRDVGYAVQMNFGISSSGGSGAILFNAVPTLIENFDYDGRLECLTRTNYSNDAWWAGIQDELNNYGPVVYGGQSSHGGHCFVIDGLAENRYVHVDWGWNYASNCWSSIDVLEPETQYDGGGVGAFNRHHQMLRYLKPSDGTKFEQITLVGGLSQTRYQKERNQSISIRIKNHRTQAFYGAFRLLISKAGRNDYRTLEQSYNMFIDGNGERDYQFLVDLSGYQEGTYDIRVSYSKDERKWVEISQNAGQITIGNAKPEPKPEPTPEIKDQFSIAKQCEQTAFSQEAGQKIAIGVNYTGTQGYYDYLKLAAKKEGGNGEYDLGKSASKVYIDKNGSKTVVFYADFSKVQRGKYDLRISYVSNGNWKEIDASAGQITVNNKAIGARIVATAVLPTLSTFEQEAVRVEIPVANQGDEDFNGKIQLLANGSPIAEGTQSIKSDADAMLVFTTNTTAFNRLKAGEYTLTVAYGNGQRVMYANTANLGKLIIKSKQQPTPSVGDVRINSAFFYQNGRYKGSKYCTVSRNSDLTVKAYLYSSNGFNGPVKVFMSDNYGSKAATNSALEVVKNVKIDKHGSGYVEVSFDKAHLTGSRYYINVSYNDGTKDICKTYDAIAFYVSSYYNSYNNDGANNQSDKGFTVYVDDFTDGFTYIPVGAEEKNLVVGDVTAIETIDVQGVSLFPTVASENVTIATAEAGMAYIYSTTGAKVAEIVLKEGNNTVAVSQFTPGVYFVKVANKTLKFIKK